MWGVSLQPRNQPLEALRHIWIGVLDAKAWTSGDSSKIRSTMWLDPFPPFLTYIRAIKPRIFMLVISLLAQWDSLANDIAQHVCLENGDPVHGARFDTPDVATVHCIRQFLVEEEISIH
ncbi:hypothetical protein PAXRUDRAFT_22783 [Paxillus rubicundulus Ve08.2h10]|uniref:Uncharacterized protein n=1 Tax=Paxillus rubicundulus Ve08.2h10 TaxID=930991 RepID=A0A0D0C857_9AGAM|nr:hypothetical protein PAXRUDRAFT_22783 [Paxillus rubicundulus Ve08.2h10]